MLRLKLISINKKSLFLLLPISLLPLLGLWAESNPINDSPARAVIMKHHHFFKTAYTSSPPSSATEELDHFFSIMLNRKLSTVEWRNVVTTYASQSLAGQLGPEKATGYVQHAEVAELLITLLASEDKESRRNAKFYLTYLVTNTLRWKYSDQIKEALGPDAVRNPNHSYLLAKCTLTDREKETILNLPGQNHPVIRILCGDRAVEAKLVADFNAETDYNRKSRLARQLGLAGTAACAKALVAELDSKVELHQQNWHYSIRYNIILALGRIYDQEPLFTEKAYLMSSHSDELFDQFAGLKVYARDVNEWSLENYGHPAWDEEKVWFWNVDLDITPSAVEAKYPPDAYKTATTNAP